VTTSYDGYIRLYDENFNLIKKKKAPGGKKPFHISFSPDGSKIAVGYDDTPNVDVLSSDDLEKLYSADTSDFSGCNFYGVTFSSDGLYLYAGGRCEKQFNGEWKFIIRRWDRAGKGSYMDIPVSEILLYTSFHLKMVALSLAQRSHPLALLMPVENLPFIREMILQT
jgi:WD40 repeat protein